ncbi:hypothetical protein [Halorubrum sp. LN27]|uniref:hypothetical protein n=1 Tax=Halorubrum sp. LN27 TaxID=2801032 RepID=UPI00190A1C68|nr:hypothetical protein [Halorubrum sp. LN27]
MRTERRTVIAASIGLLMAGCAGLNDGGSDGDAPPTDPGTDTPQCDPDDVARPPVATGTNIEGREYPRKPETLTEPSIMEYLDDFETSFAWNRILQSAEGVTSVNVDNLNGFTPDETGDGFLASSGIRASYSTEAGASDEREYIANYFVAPGAVYRHESTGDPTAPEPRDEETALVQCGTDD